ncbi:Antiviral helicase ski2 [Dimargaris cristalligena]|uniref:NUC185 domain-containing protein n=1 Tax=Dimargaris cristalligena TaxID=215637 RepID=A0A4P9ZZI0_9FUNG|nr:Antiviral helicase ski2 [Dimargaris cristalligena]RKP39117.1 NUC185 domain-containing protein [Dimargaris cristalligena]|eukprot:RKP39117.1 NUC185 domain-containing protein [Dimargaris cristalligena]
MPGPSKLQSPVPPAESATAPLAPVRPSDLVLHRIPPGELAALAGGPLVPQIPLTEPLQFDPLFPVAVDAPITNEEIEDQIEACFLRPDPVFPQHWLPTCQRSWPREPQLNNLRDTPAYRLTSILELDRDPVSFAVQGIHRVTTSENDSAIDNPASFARKTTGPDSYVRGRSSGVPFAPGGLVEAVRSENPAVDPLADFSLFEDNLLVVAPGLDHGLAVEPPSALAKSSPTMVDLLRSESSWLPQNDNKSERDGLAPPDRPLPLPTPLPTESTPIDEFLPRGDYQGLSESDVAFRRPKPTYRREWAHEVDVTREFSNFHDVVPELAHQFPFELDTFQKQAVYHLEQGDFVFVAAHTSAGKTAVAEYAIAMSLKHMTKTIYTSPIKALSNQKFRDFRKTFGDDNVGIITGDIQIQPESPCLVMTTEILRSMLYRGSDLIRDVEFVVFDEVHYVNDSERGVVWEEVIIMLPAHISLILLSATIPNTKEFADWVGRSKKRDIYVISTTHRPVPLEHYLFVDREVYKIVDQTRSFLSLGWKQARDALANAIRREKALVLGRGRGRGGLTRSQSFPDRIPWTHLIEHLKKKELLPAIVFTFSRRRCEEYAASLNSANLNSLAERTEVRGFIYRSLLRLSVVDRGLPHIRHTSRLLERGIGIHHGGLLPIVKEMVEILFSRGLVKVLFATETFAMGVNMPARTVVFSSIRKHDGRTFRDLLPGEYTQMAGRAGRRGLDSTGLVMIVGASDVPDSLTLQKMILGPATKLQSQFRLTYPMILNLLRVETLKVEEMIKRSFSENTNQKSLPEAEQELLRNESQLAKVGQADCVICQDSLKAFHATQLQLDDTRRRLYLAISSSPLASKGWQSGRVVILTPPGRCNPTLGVIIRTQSHSRLLGPDALSRIAAHWTTTPVSNRALASSRQLTCLIVGNEQGAWADSRGKIATDSEDDLYPFLDGIRGEGDVEVGRCPFTLAPLEEASLQSRVVTVDLASVAVTTDVSLKIDAGLLLKKSRTAETNRVEKELVELAQSHQKDGWAEYDWGAKIKELDFQIHLRALGELRGSLTTFACIHCPDLVSHLEAKLQALRHALSDQNLELLPDYEQRLEVLRTLQCIDQRDNVLLKGRVACEINAADALILTELILDNVMAEFEPCEIAAMLCCFIFQDRNAGEPYLVPNLVRAKDHLIQALNKVDQIQMACGVADSLENTLCFGLMEVVYEWARGMTFRQIMDLTDVQEGIIVRAIIRLDDVCREVRTAARTVGDNRLLEKMEQVSSLIRRDIVFTASLYY